MEVNTIQIRQRGVITLPAKLRQRHSLEVGDTLTFIEKKCTSA
jgi:bifunctional DNA-binding transcriptional regulator/antitoxin component of YhaV-PrlF toxin-antitoxin module